jgi:hypothetical protein
MEKAEGGQRTRSKQKVWQARRFSISTQDQLTERDPLSQILSQCRLDLLQNHICRPSPSSLHSESISGCALLPRPSFQPLVSDSFLQHLPLSSRSQLQLPPSWDALQHVRPTTKVRLKVHTCQEANDVPGCHDAYRQCMQPCAQHGFETRQNMILIILTAGKREDLDSREHICSTIFFSSTSADACVRTSVELLPVPALVFFIVLSAPRMATPSVFSRSALLSSACTAGVRP